jgi:hypothetical protein
MRSLRYAWALPASLVGAAFAAMWLAGGAACRRVDGTIEVSGGALANCVRRLPGAMRFGAITFGHVIIGVDEACLAACRDHERVHVRQYERWGVFFFPLYAASSAIAWLRGGDPYLDNHFEREAFRATPRSGGGSTRSG